MHLRVRITWVLHSPATKSLTFLVNSKPKIIVHGESTAIPINFTSVVNKNEFSQWLFNFLNGFSPSGDY